MINRVLLVPSPSSDGIAATPSGFEFRQQFGDHHRGCGSNRGSRGGARSYLLLLSSAAQHQTQEEDG